ncbi:MAG: hypothetical protein R3B70_20760 [Polyangiaceae bacterium]
MGGGADGVRLGAAVRAISPTTAGWLVAGLVIARLVLAAWTAQAGRPRGRGGARRGRFGLVRAVVLGLVLASLGGGLAVWGPRSMAASVPVAVVLGMFVVWPIARYVMAPLGLVRAAYYVGLGSWTTPEDRAGRGLLAGAIALHRRRDFDPEAAGWLEEKIQAQRSIRGGTIVAAAAAAAARGDREGARALFDSIHTLDPRALPLEARHTAMEWLAADAASRGKWEEVVDLAASGAEAGRAAWLLGQVGRRLLGSPAAPSRAALLWAWLLAPRRRHTFAIVERALSVPDGGAPVFDEDDDAPAPHAQDGDALAKALAEHVRLLSMKKPAPADVAHTGRAFDAALDDDGLRDELAKRAEAIGATRWESVLHRFRDEIETSLFQLLKDHRIALDDTALDLGDVAAGAQRRLRDEVLGVIEALSSAVRSRADERRALPAIDEWREFSALRMAYERGVALCGPELRYLAFSKVHGDLCALAVWLFNERDERAIGHSMLRFLLQEARAVGDERAIELQEKNVAIGI